MERCQLIANALDGESEVLQCVVTTTSAKADALDARIDNLAASLDIVFLLFASIVMFTMQAGFAMFCAGSVRRKNVHNTLLKNFLDACGCAFAFFVCGYAFAYGGTKGVIFPEDMNVPHPTTFIGTENFLLIDFDNYALWMYQFAFAATCTTIVAGALAERSQMVAYFFYSTLLSGFVFPVNAHAVWSIGGFLNANKSNRLFGSGMIDFAGSGVVHFTGGLTALIASKVLGPRKDRFNEDLGNPLHVPNPIQGCSVSLQVLGTLLLWFGWYGFNAGGLHFVFTEEYANVAALATVTTTLSAACGTISSLALSAYYSYRQSGEIKFEVSYALNGCLSGLVAITGSCAFIEPWVSLIIGMVAGVIYNLASRFMVHCRIDDAVDAIPVHLFNGIWGVIAVGLFASPDRMETAFGRMDHVGWFYSWGRGSSDATLLAANIVGLLLIFCFVVVVMYPFFSILMYLGWLRSDPLEEILGLDCRYHRGKTHREIDHEDADESLIESSDNLQEFNLIGKTNGRFLLGKSNAPFKRKRHESWVSPESLTKIYEHEEHTETCASNRTAPCNSTISDPSSNVHTQKDISSNAADEIDAHPSVASNISLLDLELSTTDCNRTSFR